MTIKLSLMRAHRINIYADTQNTAINGIALCSPLTRKTNMPFTKNTLLSLSIILITIGMYGCGSTDEPTPTAETTPTNTVATTDNADDIGTRINDYFEEIFDREVAQSPNLQTSLGIKTSRQGEWSDTSDAYAAKELRESKADLAYLTENFSYDELDEGAKLSYDLFKYGIESNLNDTEFRRSFYVVDQFNGQFASPLTLLQNTHRIDSAQDAEDYISRLNGIERLMTDMVVRLQDRADSGVIPPAFAFPAMITDISRILSGTPIDNSDTPHPLYADFEQKVNTLDISDEEKIQLINTASEAIKGPFRRGYTALLNEIKRQQPLQDENQGVWALPNGAAFYENRIQSHTTLNLSAAEIHQLGLQDVARIHEEMKAIMEEVNFAGSLQDFFSFVRTDPNNFYPDSDAGREQFLQEARQQTAEIFAVAGDYFHQLPKAELEVRRVEPWRENSTSIAFYNRPSQDGSRPGIYYANLADMKGVQKYVFRAITYHEGVPGHHFQIALAQEMEGLPTFRKFSGYNAFAEGWALYAEKLAREMGFYQDPMHNFGRLQDEIWRSVRLVTDTGIHAMRWSRQQAIDYFMENTPISEQDIITEVERYFVNPGQALGYKMGMIKILELRAKAQAELGEQYDIRDFHHAVIGAGSLPLPILERRVNAYIAQ